LFVIVCIYLFDSVKKIIGYCYTNLCTGSVLTFLCEFVYERTKRNRHKLAITLGNLQFFSLMLGIYRHWPSFPHYYLLIRRVHPGCPYGTETGKCKTLLSDVIEKKTNANPLATVYVRKTVEYHNI